MNVHRLFVLCSRLFGFLSRGFRVLGADETGTQALHMRYARYYKYARIRENAILYEDFFGRGMTDNGYALFAELSSARQYKGFHHYVVLDDMRQNARLLDQYRQNPQVHFVAYNGKRYAWLLATAKYLVNNTTFPSWFTKKDGQVYINCWHGIPLKTLGYDDPDGNIAVANIVRNFLSADYLVSACPFLTQVYRDAFKMGTICPGTVIEEGYPRLDLLSTPRDAALKKLAGHGIRVPQGKKVILFAPTWRGATFKDALPDVDSLVALKETLESLIDTTRYAVLVKPHQRVFQLCAEQCQGDFLVPATIPCNEVLAATDILISDFSSIYFDFLALDRPVLFYIPDLEAYKEQRGLYMTPDELPGPHTDSIKQLAAWINGLGTAGSVDDTWRPIRHEQQKKYNLYTGKNYAKKICAYIFSGEQNGIRTRSLATNKTKLFINRGPMMVNGISSSLLALLSNMDYEKYDVTLMVSATKKEAERNLIDSVPRDVRVLYRSAGATMTFAERLQNKIRTKYGCRALHAPMYRREWRRCVGSARFDRIIDFDGYNRFFTILNLQQDGGEKIIWLHNNMFDEYTQKFPWLKEIFRRYGHYDRLVSCSQKTMEVNRAALSPRYAPPSKFFFAGNCMNVPLLTQRASGSRRILFEGTERIKISESGGGGAPCSVQFAPYVPPVAPDGTRNLRFVNVGRLSVEKNQAALIRAFSRFVRERPHAYLYILGDGPLNKEVTGLVARLGLGRHVFVLGTVENPFAVMRECDCFILPSLHEGQPMAINEARFLRMPIIVSRYDGVESACVPGGQYICAPDEDGIYGALEAFEAGKVPTDYDFDPAAYNKRMYAEFLKAIGERE